MRMLGWSLVVLLFAAGQTATAQPAFAMSAPKAALEQEARQIERMLIAPCCWMQPVSEHSSQASDEVKLQIREWLGRGMTREQVLDAFVAKYGVRILAEPPNRGFSRFLYLTPWLVFGVSAVGLVALVKRMTAGRAGAGAGGVAVKAPPEPTGDGSRTDYDQQLDDELRDMD